MSLDARRREGERLDPGSPEFMERLKRLYRYAQLGRCVNGVTHELNNHLGAVMAYAELVSLDKNLTPQSQRMLLEIVEGVRRATNLLNVFTGVARKEKVVENAVSTATLLAHVADLQSYNVKCARARLDVRCAPDLPSFLGDAPKLELALNYLVMNALQAIEGIPSGAVAITAAHEDGEIVLSIKDNGEPPGAGLRETMFEPFVTSHDAPHIGLGLHLAREIFELHGGSLAYDAGHGIVGRLPLNKSKSA